MFSNTADGLRHSVAMTEPNWPSRSEIKARWFAILDGSCSREDVHGWTVPWVEGEGPSFPPTDTMVGTALQMLHGFTMAFNTATPHLIHHGPPGFYVRSLDDIRDDFDCWRRDCDEFDADPDLYRERRRTAARKLADHERRQDRGGS